ncbi:MAG: amino acid ABC transporter permease [Clostridiales bacterium]|uniref:Polar amino acid transport system permease protein n=1 Tax=Peptococcus niger TaxID=2741 RepID=A0A1G6WH38_PEPNI|nr:amino acid ABC transporter permease [Peptococcus niger]MBS5915523.1 amino acid ABC transporter permease [Clostridiales bacterium]MDU7505848.1 amino acid ABC transporter permease [Clostridia bacterium]MDU1028869.1 amino acid ABC transporter permease [Clostridiales bacterium]MDU5952219.1 amino acid ABC transporter permease [Clostridiales bacterium]MDU7245587.1 amino acid ABC transporter permease [Clostridiales bacterium]
MDMLIELSQGFRNTLAIFFITLALAMPLGFVVMLLKKSRFKPVSLLTTFYISVMRGTPLMLQLMFVYFGPYYLFGLSSPDRFRAAIVAFVFNYAAYFAEIYRGGFEAIPRGQLEAAEVLGLSKAQTFFKIQLPQVMKTVMPSITNEVITLVKDTSLAMVISVSETFIIAKAMAAREASMTPYLAVAAFYYAMNYLVAFIMDRIEKGLDYYR